MAATEKAITTRIKELQEEILEKRRDFIEKRRTQLLSSVDDAEARLQAIAFVPSGFEGRTQKLLNKIKNAVGETIPITETMFEGVQELLKKTSVAGQETVILEPVASLAVKTMVEAGAKASGSRTTTTNPTATSTSVVLTPAACVATATAADLFIKQVKTPTFTPTICNTLVQAANNLTSVTGVKVTAPAPITTIVSAAVQNAVKIATMPVTTILDQIAKVFKY